MYIKETLTAEEQIKLYNLFRATYLSAEDKENLSKEDFRKMASNPNELFYMFSDISHFPDLSMPPKIVRGSGSSIFSPLIVSTRLGDFTSTSSLLTLLEKGIDFLEEKTTQFNNRIQPPHERVESLTPEILDMAILSADVYNRFPGTEIGFREWFVEKSINEPCGLQSRLYKKNGEYVYAIAGTNGLGDWWVNFKQYAIRESVKFKKALEIAQCLQKKYTNIKFVGHSQGGGAAAYCAYKLNKKAYTFNALGIDFVETGKNVPANHQSLINAYILENDPLNMFLDFFGRNQADGIKHYIHSPHPVKDSHKIKTVIEDIKEFIL